MRENTKHIVTGRRYRNRVCVYPAFKNLSLCCLPSQIRCLKGQRSVASQSTFDGVHIVNHYVGDDESYQSSDDDAAKDPTLQATQQRSGARIKLHPNLGDTDSEEEDGEALRLSVPQSSSHKTTTV